MPEERARAAAESILVSEHLTTKQGIVVREAKLKYGISSGVTFEKNLDELCRQLLHEFRLEEAAKKFDRKKYCAELHNRVTNLPDAEKTNLYSLK